MKVFHLIRSLQRPHFTCAGFRATCLCFKILSSSWPCEIEAIGRLLRACTTLQDQSGPLQLTPTAQTSRPRALQVANHEWFHSSSDAELPASTLCLDCIKCPLKSKSYYHDSTVKKWNGKVKKIHEVIRLIHVDFHSIACQLSGWIPEAGPDRLCSWSSGNRGVGNPFGRGWGLFVRNLWHLYEGYTQYTRYYVSAFGIVRIFVKYIYIYTHRLIFIYIYTACVGLIGNLSRYFWEHTCWDCQKIRWFAPDNPDQLSKRVCTMDFEDISNHSCSYIHCQRYFPLDFSKHVSMKPGENLPSHYGAKELSAAKEAPWIYRNPAVGIVLISQSEMKCNKTVVIKLPILRGSSNVNVW